MNALLCGRILSCAAVPIQTYTDDEISFLYLNRRPLKFGPLKPNYNISPTHNVPNHGRRSGIRQYALGIDSGIVSRVFHEAVDDQREERNDIRKPTLQEGDRPEAVSRSRQWIRQFSRPAKTSS
jgi:hypothetical protein